MKPGEVFEHEGRYFRLRHPDEWVEPTDYHVSKQFKPSGFSPCLPVHFESGSRDKEVWQHVHEISALSYAMRKALERSKHHERA